MGGWVFPVGFILNWRVLCDSDESQYENTANYIWKGYQQFWILEYAFLFSLYEVKFFYKAKIKPAQPFSINIKA